MPEIHLHQHVPAPPADVWRVYTDHEQWPEWAGVREVVVRQPGHPAPNGLGAIRVVRTSGLAVEEEIVAFDPPERLRYRMIAGAPVRNYEAEVRFAPEDGGTRVEWEVHFDPLVPLTGGLLARLLKSGLEDTLSRLASYSFAHA